MATTHRTFVSQNYENAKLPPLVTLAVLRERGSKAVEIGHFLIDMGCFGVKDAWFVTLPPEGLDEHLDRVFEYGRVEKPAAWGRKLAEAALDFRRSIGFATPRDYKKAARVFGGIDAAACKEAFTFGKDGKPFYIQGPNESNAEARRIMEHLGRRFGRGGFEFLVKAETPYADKLESQVQAYVDSAEEGLVKKARRGLEELLDAHPDAAEVHFGFGCLYNAEKDTASAAAAFERSLELKPEQRNALYNYGVCQAELGELGPAIRALRECVRLGPEEPDSLSRDAEQELAELEETVREQFGIATDVFLRTDPIAREAPEHIEAERWKEAEDSFRRATEVAPDCARYWSMRGLCILRQEERFDDAVACIDRALALDPDLEHAAHARKIAERFMKSTYSEDER